MIAEASESTRSEYAARMNRVVDHIQGHLAELLDLERLAAVACFSPFHFHRLFRAWMRETLPVFVHRLRLERAAQLLVFNRLRSISDIALECGFSSSSAFARAFKGAFGVSASEWRKRKICQSNRKPWEAGEDASLGFSKLPGPMARNKEIPMTNFRASAPPLFHPKIDSAKVVTAYVVVAKKTGLTLATSRRQGASKSGSS